MYCVKSRQVIEEIIKKSRFIGVIVPCASEIEVLQHLKQLHEEHLMPVILLMRTGLKQTTA